MLLVLPPTHDCLLNSDTLVQNGVSNARCGVRTAELLRAWVSFLADCPSFTAQGGKPKRVILSFVQYVSHNPIRQTILQLSDLADKIMIEPTLFGQGTLTGTFEPDMLNTPVAFEYIRWFRSGDPELYQFILGFLTFGKKFEYIDEELHAIALRDWLETEERIKQVEFDDQSCRDLKTIIGQLVDFAPAGLQPLAKHGPGTVSDGGRTLYAKANALYDNPMLERAFSSRVFPRVEGFDDWNTVIPNKSGLVPIDAKQAQHRRTAEQLFAWKTVKTARTICREPTQAMYGQQLILQNLMANWRDMPIFRYCDLWDQTPNQRGAEFGSYTGACDSIDIKAASDSVSVRLVKRVFPRELLFYMLATRTSRVILPNGKRVTLEKFAPMGSALCFPTQCIIFTAICVLGYIEAWNDGTLGGLPGAAEPGTLTGEFVRTFLKHVVASDFSVKTKYDVFQPIRVFGDDIVCDSRATPHIIRLLTSFGFIVNESKSFQSSQAVRESCGKYYWNGHDVTPLRFSRSFSEAGDVEDASSLSSLIAFANRCGDYGYRHLHSFMIRRTLRVPVGNNGVALSQGRGGFNAIGFTNDMSKRGSMLYSNRPVNAHLDKAWDTYLQRGVMRTITLRKRVDDREFSKFSVIIEANPRLTNLESNSYSLWWTAASTRGNIQSPQGLWVNRGGVSWDTLLETGWTPS